MKTARPLKQVRVLRFGKTELEITNFNKIFFPAEGITKGQVLEYYQAMSAWLLPYLKGRPQSLRRNPNGLLDKGFFHKDAGDEAPSWVKSIKLFSESANRDIDYILCNNKATLAYLNQLGCIEINPWHSAVPDLNKPDYLVIDLDPSPANTFDQVIEAAHVIHGLLEKAGALHFCKTSGASGLHIYVPLGKKYDYEQAKNFAQLVCNAAQEEIPRFTSLERSLSKRGKKIYLDYLQNRRGQTIASPYSIRPLPRAPVSMPLLWKELKPGFSPLQFNIRTAPVRVRSKGDIFKGILGRGIDMKKCLRFLEPV